MSDQRQQRFSGHVHEVVDLDRQGASLEAIVARVATFDVEVDERAAFLQLACSLRGSSRARRDPHQPRAFTRAAAGAR